MCIKSKSKKDV